MKLPEHCECGGILTTRGDIEPFDAGGDDWADEVMVCETCGQIYRAVYQLSKVVKLKEYSI